MRYEIYTNQTFDPTREYSSFDGYVLGAHMKRAYTDTIEYEGTLKLPVLEQLFEKFNNDHPADYKAHSLCVGDVIVLSGPGWSEAYACESVGWKQLTSFLPEIKNPFWFTR